ncbi:MAG: HPP family protein [Candidatus Hydrothermarchaeales archaeon]
MDPPLKLDAKVADIMTTDIVDVNFDTPVSDLIRTMVDKDISGIIVVDNVGEIMGVISVIDIFKIFNEGSDADVKKLVAEDIMTPFFVGIYQEDSLKDAALKMLQHDIHRLVVISTSVKRKAVGIITSTDVLNEIAKEWG